MIKISPAVLLLMLSFFLWRCQDSSTASGGQASGVDFKRKDNVVYARLPAEPDRLNPILAASTYARVVNEQLFLNLLHFNPTTLELEPQLAKSPPVVEEINEGPNAGGVAYTFEIHEVAVWDDGSPITGHDLAFTLKAILNPKVNAAHYRAYLEFISEVEVNADHPKAFTVYANKKYILGEPAISNMTVLPAHIYDPEGLLSPYRVADLSDPEAAARLVESDPGLQAFADAFNSPKYSREKGFISGSGPYTFEGWETGQKIELSRKTDWWGDDLKADYPMLSAAPERLVFTIIPDQTAMLAALKDEQIDVTSQIDAEDFVGLRDNELVSGRYELHTPPALVYYFIGLNNKSPKLADKRVRQALAHLLDVDELINTLYNGLATRTVGPFHPTKPYYHDELPPIPFDPEQARSLLAEAGWEDTNGNGIVDKNLNGVLTELELDYIISSASKFANNQALLFQDNAKRAGVSINIVPKEFTVLIDQVKKRDYEIYSSGWGQAPIPDDPKQLWHSESDTPSGGNRVSFRNEEADRLIEAIQVTLDEQKRRELYLEFQELIYEEQPYIFLFSPLERIAISKRFEAMASARRPGFFVQDFVLRDVAPQ